MSFTTPWNIADVPEIPITPPVERKRYDIDVIVAISTVYDAWSITNESCPKIPDTGTYHAEGRMKASPPKQLL